MRMEGITIFFKPAAGMDAFLAGQQLAGSPAYRQWLTPEQFGERFGLSANDVVGVNTWLESNGLHVDRVARGRHWITFSGSARQAGRAFRTEFHRFTAGGASHFANATPPQIPVALAGVVSGLVGLNDFPRIMRSAAPMPLANLGSGNHALSPDDFATIYNLSPVYQAGLDGTGQKIAIIGSSALDLTDTRLFRKTFGLAASDPQTVVVGRDPGIVSNAYLEAQLDIQWASAVARNAQIVYVYGSDPLVAAAYAVDNNLAPVVSMSFGDCEAYDNFTMQAVAQQGNAQGMTLLAATGDYGSAMCDASSPTPQASKGVTVSAPASMPEVTAVGGTQLNDAGGRYWNLSQSQTLSSAVSYIPETVWNEYATFGDLNSATGGGPSAVFPKPWWQSAPGVPDDHARDLPDLSLTAGAAHDGYLIVYQGTLAMVGGTSAATPAFAGVVALLNQALTAKGVLANPGLGNINPTLYRLARAAPFVFHDITAGDNRLPCRAA
jgi:subtilase family serine protease